MGIAIPRTIWGNIVAERALGIVLATKGGTRVREVLSAVSIKSNDFLFLKLEILSIRLLELFHLCFLNFVAFASSTIQWCHRILLSQFEEAFCWRGVSYENTDCSCSFGGFCFTFLCLGAGCHALLASFLFTTHLTQRACTLFLYMKLLITSTSNIPPHIN